MKGLPLRSRRPTDVREAAVVVASARTRNTRSDTPAVSNQHSYLVITFSDGVHVARNFKKHYLSNSCLWSYIRPTCALNVIGLDKATKKIK